VDFRVCNPFLFGDFLRTNKPDCCGFNGFYFCNLNFYWHIKQKEKILFLHESSSNEKLYCLSNSPQLVELLLEKDKKYNQFLKGLYQKNFFKDLERINVTKIASALGFKPTLITKWIAQICDDIYELNIEEPDLFKSLGIRHDCYLHNNDNHTALSIWLPQTSREYERFEFYFLKVKLGTNSL
jgi:hypothetical protein